MGGDVQGLAYNDVDGEAAVLCSGTLTIYGIHDGARLCKFKSFGQLFAVALARVPLHRLVLDGHRAGDQLVVRDALTIQNTTRSRTSTTLTRVRRETSTIRARASVNFKALKKGHRAGGWREPYAAHWEPPEEDPGLREEILVSDCVLRVNRVEVNCFAEMLLHLIDGPVPTLLVLGLVVASVTLLVLQLSGVLPDSARVVRFGQSTAILFMGESLVRAGCHLEVHHGAGKGCEIPNFKGSYLGRFPLVLANFWTSDHLSERPRT